MKPMLTALLALTALSPAAHAADLFPSSTFCETNRSNNAVQTFNDLKTKISGRHSEMIARDLGGAFSIGPVNHAITSLRPTRICASAIAFSKNIYRYHEYLITFVLTLPSGETRVIPLLFQASSVQGHHGIGKNPWSGVPRAGLLALAERELGGLEFRDTNASSLDELLKQSLRHGPQEEVEEGSVSIVPILDAQGRAKYYVAGEFFRIPNQNPFLEISGSRGVALRRVNGRWQAAAIGSLHGFYQAVDELKTKSAPASNSDQAITQKLLEISR